MSEVVVILGRTVEEAKYWKKARMEDYPELKDAKAVGTYSTRALDGIRLTKLFITPFAIRGYNYPTVMLVLDRGMRKMPGDTTVIQLKEML